MCVTLSFWSVHRSAILDAWATRVFDEYPGATRLSLRAETDPFRNPVGAAVRDALPRLYDQIVGDMDRDTLIAALDDIIRIRIVQDFPSARAGSFVPELKAVAHDAARDALIAIEPAVSTVDDRIGQVGLLATEVLARCRQRLADVRANEERRQVAVLQRRRTAPSVTDARGHGSQAR
jgi:hypothetical protein